MFCDSDTTMAALSMWPGIACTDAVPLDGGQCGLPLSNESNKTSRDHINELAKKTQRIVNHYQVMAQDAGGVEAQLLLMEQLRCTLSPVAWKLYPGFSVPKAFTMDDAIGRAVIEKGIELGLPLFCIHKGLPIGSFFDVDFGNHPREIGNVAKEYPEAKFIIYHSGICTGFANCNMAPPEGPYNETEENPVGVNAFIRSVVSAGLQPNSNVYAETGSSYNRAAVYQDPTIAAHYFGKLMKYIGTDNVCWGTDCVISGSPQPYIEALRALEIPQSMRDQYGYPALDNTTPEGQLNQAKIFGLNAAKAYGVDPEKIRCELDQCPITARKKLMDEELGSRRWSFQPPGGPKTYDAFLEDSYAAAALGRPG
jgi:predicted TIM-barrel fold metal-dependent hydrolase